MTDKETLLTLDLLGYRARVTAPDGAMLTQVAAIFDDLRVPDDEPVDTTHYRIACDDATGWSLSVNDERVYTGAGCADMLIALEWQLITDLVAHRRDWFHLHAAALADPSGSCGVLIVGVSGSGKTTLTLALMASGFLPYADDVTLIAPETLMPHTLRRAFHADDATRALVGALGAPPVWRSAPLPDGYTLLVGWARADVPIRFVLFPTLVPLSVADAVAALLPYSMTLSHDPALALAVAARLTRDARCFALSTGDLGATAACVRALAAGEYSPTSES